MSTEYYTDTDESLFRFVHKHKAEIEQEYNAPQHEELEDYNRIAIAIDNVCLRHGFMYNDNALTEAGVDRVVELLIDIK